LCGVSKDHKYIKCCKYNNRKTEIKYAVHWYTFIYRTRSGSEVKNKIKIQAIKNKRYLVKKRKEKRVGGCIYKIRNREENFSPWRNEKRFGWQFWRFSLGMNRKSISQKESLTIIYFLNLADQEYLLQVHIWFIESSLILFLPIILIGIRGKPAIYLTD